MPPNWDQKSFHEKVSWRCQNPDPDVDYALLADKYRVKEVVTPYCRVARVYDIVDTPKHISIDKLPDSYVMKATHGTNMCLLVRDGIIQGQNRDLSMAGTPADNKALRQVAGRWLRSYRDKMLRINEIHYGFLKPRIMFEECLTPIDYEYQFFLFHGRCRLTMVVKRDFYLPGSIGYRIYDETWCRLGPGSADTACYYDDSPEETPPPKEQLLQELSQVCRNIDHVRIDVFMKGTEDYFSEFTFTHNGGLQSLLGKYDRSLGRFWTRSATK